MIHLQKSQTRTRVVVTNSIITMLKISRNKIGETDAAGVLTRALTVKSGTVISITIAHTVVHGIMHQLIAERREIIVRVKEMTNITTRDMSHLSASWPNSKNN